MGLFDALYRVVMRRNAVYVTFVVAGAFAGERAVDYGVHKLWEMNNVGCRAVAVASTSTESPKVLELGDAIAGMTLEEAHSLVDHLPRRPRSLVDHPASPKFPLPMDELGCGILCRAHEFLCTALLLIELLVQVYVAAVGCKHALPPPPSAPESPVEEEDEMGESVGGELCLWASVGGLAPEMDIDFWIAPLETTICKDAMHFTPAIQIEEVRGYLSFGAKACRGMRRLKLNVPMMLLLVKLDTI